MIGKHLLMRDVIGADLPMAAFYLRPHELA
jgi:hypothetical protein